jgi:Transposase DDE domain
MERRLWLELYRIIIALGKTHSFSGKRFSDACIALVFLKSVLHDRPRCWACDMKNWGEGGRDCPWVSLPSPTTMSRRLRTVGVLLLLEQAQDFLRRRLPRRVFKWIDAKPLPVGGGSKDRDAKAGRAVRGMARGYKLHAIFDAAGPVEHWRLAPMSQNEKPVARELLPALAGSGALYVSGDGGYDGNSTFDAAASGKTQLVVNCMGQQSDQKPKGLGHRPQSPHRLRCLELTSNPMAACGVKESFGQSLLRARAGIERRFGLLGNFAGGLSPLPNWVRKPRRVALWVAGKILIYLARDHRRLQEKKREKQIGDQPSDDDHLNRVAAKPIRPLLLLTQ